VPLAVSQPAPAARPEDMRLLATDCWTKDTAVASLIAAARALVAVGTDLRELSAQRPPIDRLIGDEVGSLWWDSVPTGRINHWRRELRATGIVGQICTELENLRSRWIAARLSSEGLRSTTPEIGPWYERFQLLEEQAPTVADLWSGAATLNAPAPLD
jgi:hypothetical protein